MALWPPSRSSSSSSHDHLSVRSFLTSSENTAFSDHKYGRYIDDSTFKSLPAIPSDDYDPYLFHQPQPQVQIHPLTSASQLATALGPDNTRYSTEIATIPCAGVRIPHGSLSGLIAWRLVVTLPPPVKAKRCWWNESSATEKRQRRNSSNILHSYSYSDPPQSTWTSNSAVSLPLTSVPLQMQLDNPPRPLPRTSRVESTPMRPPHITDVTLVCNFILDTSLPYSIISRDTLMELGYPSHKFPPSNPHSNQWEDHPDAIVTLSIQSIPTRLRIARPGEASRLGVQFLQDASVSIFFPRDGEGVGPVLYSESASLLKDAPRPITSFAAGARAPKPSLPNLVRALFGLA
ncbi:hypothetical protein M413DRAFT_208077 [Hebeloma cylindrosporum]|uniref:Uncharacterized protein n=1 Tax=Hebeloma cylindrosporum TaxID=76867 RepID=A0A0C2Z389_HEBCY|nr:hypothetical protein M413DRAFT_208077 [Hebeloma cylindrosporum h7]